MEHDIIRWLTEQVPTRPPTLVGIGDDAAVLQGNDDSLVLTTDVIIDGVHFQRDRQALADIGHKAIAVNFSDLAAMGSWPIAVVVGLVLPPDFDLAAVQQLYAGMLGLCDSHAATLAGGDTNVASSPLIISVAALGRIAAGESAWRCSGARVGDQILVSGTLGGSILGKHLTFLPRCALAEQIRRLAAVRAATDISDGLLLDLSSLANGVGVEVERDAVPIAPAARRLAVATPGTSALDHAFYDGEDFELILAVDAGDAERLCATEGLDAPLTRIGQVVADPGVHVVDARGARVDYPLRGYEHGLRR